MGCRGFKRAVVATALLIGPLMGCGRATNAPRALLDDSQSPLQADWESFCQASAVKPGHFVLSYPADTPHAEVDRLLAEVSSAGFWVDEESRREGRFEVDQAISWSGVVTDAVSQIIQTKVLAFRLPGQASVRCAGLDTPDVLSTSG